MTLTYEQKSAAKIDGGKTDEAKRQPLPQSASKGDRLLGVATKTWFIVTLISQWVFLSYLLAFYAPSTLTGNFQLWKKNPMLMQGFLEGDTAGNLAFAAHALLAVIIAFGGAMQLIPKLRKIAPKLHRWNGRLFMLTVFFLSITGLYMVWFRETPTVGIANLAITLNALLILAFGWLSLRTAMKRDIAAHRRWALRLYLVSNAQLFTRVGLFAWIIVAQGPVGMGANFDGPVVIFWSFGCYLVPLLILELYLRIKQNSTSQRKLVIAAVLFFTATLTAVGTFGVTMYSWIPAVKAVNDKRVSIADTLSMTILNSGIEQAVQQYSMLKNTEPKRYNFDESELRNLGKKLIANKRYGDAVKVLQLNTIAYPQSARALVRLAEAYLAAGDRASALLYCQQALSMNPEDTAGLALMAQLNQLSERKPMGQ
ncbi:DUF2306 domain-containing protein [Undibacterium sp.]|uniref:DUF2306 domain-containing protein n=1 Tax=Undibacterium sp. TaxID=1914977 RepID=UPI0037507C21